MILLNSEKQCIKIWKKAKSNSDKIWTIWKKGKLNSEKIWKIWKISVLVSFNRSWLEKYQWLRYSESENGVFCLCCVLFNSSEHAFVKNSVNDWANLGTLIKRRLGQPGHSRCLEMSEN
jgi:hypothetical protein